MKTFFINAVSNVKFFGFDIILFIAGIAGGIAFLTKSPKLTRVQKFTSVLSGGFTANYLTPVVCLWFSIPDSYSNGIAFLLGYGGLKSVESIFMVFSNKIKKEV